MDKSVQFSSGLSYSPIMNFIKTRKFGPIISWEMGFSYIGKPFMSVYCYAVDTVLIDTGQRHMGQVLMKAIEPIALERVYLTHHHEDHSGNAAFLTRDRSLPVFIHEAGMSKCSRGFSILPYQRLTWGKMTPFAPHTMPDIFETNRHKFRVLHTPGHSKDHCVFLVESEGWLFSGDLYLGDRIKYFRSNERIHDQIVSLRYVLEFDVESLFCAHRPIEKNARQHLKTKLDFLENFCGDVTYRATKGLSAEEILRDMQIRESWGIRLLTCGNVSLRNMVMSVLRPL